MATEPNNIEAIEKEIQKLENQKYRIEKVILRLKAKKQDMLSTPTHSKWLSEEQIDAIDFSFSPEVDTYYLPWGDCATSTVDVKDYEPKITIGLMEPVHTETVEDSDWLELKREIKGSSTPWLYDLVKDKQPISGAEILILKKLGHRSMYANQLSDATGYHVSTVRKYAKILVEKKYLVVQREYIQDEYTTKWGSRNVWHIRG